MHISRFSPHILPPFDFVPALAMSPHMRVQHARTTAIAHLHATGYVDDPAYSAIARRGASAEECASLERDVVLPIEYRAFLLRWGALWIGTGRSIWGVHAGGIGDRPWRSTKHRPPYQYLVCGDYWMYGDGDQLMIDLNTPEQPFVVYLHEWDRQIAWFAPSFSLALWRLVFETNSPAGAR